MLQDSLLQRGGHIRALPGKPGPAEMTVGGCIGVARREKIEMGDRCGGRQGEEQLYRVRKAVISAECSGTKGIHLRHDGFRPADGIRQRHLASFT